MPVISAFADHPTRPYVRVVINWADTPSVSHAGVYRVDVATGECTPLRPYICYDGWELLLSCGHGTFWDTEAPFDRPFYYITSSSEAPCIPDSLVQLDNFNRSVVAGWGEDELGNFYNIYGPLAQSQYSVVTSGGGLGRIEFDVVADAGTYAGPSVGSVRVIARVRPEEVATGNRVDQGVTFRFSNNGNTRYEVLVKWEPTGATGLRLVRIFNGSVTVVSDVVLPYTYTSASEFAIQVDAVGNHIQARAWDYAIGDPGTWQIDVVDTVTVPPGQTGAFVRVQAGNTNQPDYFPNWPYLEVHDLCKPCLPVTASTSTCTAQPLLSDTFGNRTVVDGWGSPDIGQPYVLSGGTNPGDYDVSPATGGTQALTTVNVQRQAYSDVGQPDQSVVSLSSAPVASASGGSFGQWVLGRVTDASNYYVALLGVATTGAVTLLLGKRVAGVFTALSASYALAPTHAANNRWYTELYVNGDLIQARAWLLGSPIPAFQVAVVDTSLVTGNNAGVGARLEPGSLNAPMIATWYSLVVTDPNSSDCEESTITLASDGRFWLKDPVRPCNDRPVPLCQTDAPVLPICGGGSGILFVGAGPEIYPANSFNLRPMNRRRSLSATRPRGDAVTALRLQTLTFTDRDDLLALAAPGSPLLWQGPAEYGIPDRYMDVRDVQVSSELPDLRVQLRTETLPYEVQDRPAGPTQGICGARVADICELYPTWDDLAATGMTWDDLVAGQASPVSSNPALRTWNDVNSDFASWNAVNTGGRTWNDLQAGN